ncbi:MAG TPA: head GIN domain-containing protein [Chitinophagaceae bacterium]|nr:head GIN domain-containing protein [Chitinophagaceae bacterium]
MKKLSLLFMSLLMTAGLYAQQVNDPNAEVREAKNFHGISLSSAFDVYISQSNEEAVAVSAAEVKYREHIKVEVKDGILYVGYDSKGLRWGSGNKKLKAYISFKQIDKLSISGACDVFIKGTLNADGLAINISGASDLKGKIEVKKLSVDLSGASDITINGNATQLDVEASGASNFRGYDLVTDVCDARASGASDIKITVNKELSAHASGASDVRYKGNGVIRDIKSSGSSSVSRG